VVEASWFHFLRGYDESLNRNGYGWDDIDFYQRSAARGQPLLPLGIGGIRDIPHGDEDRTRFYEQKNLQTGLDHNIALSSDRLRSVNHTGYGRLDA